ncbi:ABC-2 type transport system ATP-binding protein [Alkalihalobacillus xiaoxiensis]|uniref:ABC-2 type transport system ATP-binding protein n=1 Tax=Shouchella xiaoxiensis TaxID=766895 RepID=A0ABS2SN83_9BACI|nr:LytTR family transcriptional regulator DNA-binding domain-containing protein [Shouchella xiaoxiensis]MBM7836984.1 ABC-2 type transport system ATP-binding protein [Shouchella xiaoxiensis]
MNLITVTHVMKQEESLTILKDLNFVIEEKAQIGIKMTNKESITLFKLLAGETTPSSGKIEKSVDHVQLDLSRDGLYEDLAVSSYLTFFAKISAAKKSLEELLAVFSLLDVRATKIRDLSLDQKKRVSLLRMSLAEPQLMLIQSPLSNLSNEGIQLYLKAVNHLQAQGVSILFTSHYLEELALLSNVIYRYDQFVGLEKVDIAQDKSETEDTSANFQPQNVYKVASKTADKTIFFSPDEIDYIESLNSVSTIRIGNEYFPTDLTMNELEKRLSHFGFFRCHRSYLVNLQRVSELISYSKNSYTLILKGQANNKLPLSRNRLEEMKTLLEF